MAQEKEPIGQVVLPTFISSLLPSVDIGGKWSLGDLNPIKH